MLREAAGKPWCFFDRNYARLSMNMRVPEWDALRNAAHLLALDLKQAKIYSSRYAKC